MTSRVHRPTLTASVPTTIDAVLGEYHPAPGAVGGLAANARHPAAHPFLELG
jgi:hypothetical protein